MAIKYSIILISLLTSITSFAYGQQAQATMRVSVQVIDGVSATYQPEQAATLTHDGTDRQLGAVTLNGSRERELLVASEKILRLVNKRGEILNIPVEIRQVRRDDSVSLQYNTGNNTGISESVSGTFSGTLTTKIEYL